MKLQRCARRQQGDYCMLGTGTLYEYKLQESVGFADCYRDWPIEIVLSD